MRIIDADALLKQLEKGIEDMPTLLQQMEARRLLSIVENQPTVSTMVDDAAAEVLKEQDERIANLEKNLEAERNHSKYLYDKSQRLEGVIDALEFAVKCNGVSGPEVTLMRV